jgi:hypothetical protein
MLVLGVGGASISVRDEGTGKVLKPPAAGNSQESSGMLRAGRAQSEQRIASADWADRLRSDDFWQQMRSPQSRPDATSRRAPAATRLDAPRRFSPIERGDDQRARAGRLPSGNYRTVCVRLCDGYFWPLSFATSSAALGRDQRKCEDSCESPAKLYLAKDAQTPLEDMRDENGRYYRDLRTAFVYRTSYVESCKCRAHPWEAAAQDRHAGYARAAKPSQLRR